MHRAGSARRRALSVDGEKARPGRRLEGCVLAVLQPGLVALLRHADRAPGGPAPKAGGITRGPTGVRSGVVNSNVRAVNRSAARMHRLWLRDGGGAGPPRERHHLAGRLPLGQGRRFPRGCVVLESNVLLGFHINYLPANKSDTDNGTWQALDTMRRTLGFEAPIAVALSAALMWLGHVARPATLHSRKEAQARHAPAPPKRPCRPSAARLLFLCTRLLLIAFLTTSCGIPEAIDNLTNAATNATNKSVATLDDAINALDSPLVDWQRVLQDAIAKLDSDLQKTVRNDLSDVLTRGVSTASGEFRCDFDFIRTRIRQELILIRAKLLGTEVDYRQPALCNVVPLAVDVSRISSGDLNRLEFYGYDFDATPEVQVELVSDACTEDVTKKLTKPTHYHLILNLGGNGVTLRPDSQMLIFKWNGNPMSTISVIQPRTPVCRTMVTTVPVKSITFIPAHTRGDKDFKSHGPKVRADVTVLPFSDHVGAIVAMTAAETVSDWTTASGFMGYQIYKADPGWKIQRLILNSYESSYEYTDSNVTEDLFFEGSGGPVNKFEFMGDAPGDDAGVQTMVTVHFNALRLQLIEDANCVSPTTVLGMQRAKQIRTETFERLRPAIERVAPEVRTLEPAVFLAPPRANVR